MTLEAPPWSQTPPIFGWMPIASATFCPYMSSILRGRALHAQRVDRVLLDAGVGERLADRLDVQRDRRAARQAAKFGAPMPAMTYLPESG